MKRHYACLVGLALGAPVFAQWTTPVKLRENSSLAYPQIATSPAGQAAAFWTEVVPGSPLPTQQYTSFLTGTDWSAPSPLTAGVSGDPGLGQDFAMRSDGTLFVAWHQLVNAQTFESQIVVRKRAPGGEWEEPQIISRAGG